MEAKKLFLVITTVDCVDGDHISDIIEIFESEAEANEAAMAIAEGRYPGQETFTEHDGVQVIVREIKDGAKVWGELGAALSPGGM